MNSIRFTPEQVEKINKQNKINYQQCIRPKCQSIDTKKNPNGSMHCNTCGQNWLLP